MPQNKTRHAVSDTAVIKAAEDTIHMLHSRLQQKGDGTFVSSHEMLGIITEEYHELIQAVTRGGTQQDKSKAIRHELIDIAVACVFSVACIDEGETDWL